MTDASSDASEPGRRPDPKRIGGRVLLFVAAAVATALISAYASTIVAKVYADKAQSRAIKTALGTQLSVASVRAYTAAYAVASEATGRVPAARLLVDRNKVVSGWAAVAAQIDVSVYAHFPDTSQARAWRRFETALYDLGNLSYVVNDADRALWAGGVHRYLAGTGERPPLSAPTSSRSPWVVLACSEPGCAASPEWLADFRWAGLWLTHERQRLILDFFSTDVQNPA